MDTTTTMKPKTMAQLRLELGGILSTGSMVTQQPRQNITHSHTTEKVPKPLRLAEMKAELLSLRGKSPKRAQPATTSRKKFWNSSAKIDRTISHTANGKMKHNPVRKVLDFQPKPKPASSRRPTMAPASPKFLKPGLKPKPLFSFQAQHNVRISGINHIAETPIVNKPIYNRMARENKENIANPPSISKIPPPPLIPMRPLFEKKVLPAVPDTPLFNESWRSSCNASFLLNEKEVNDAEEKLNGLSEEQTQNIDEITPPASTPFKKYRNVEECFTNSSELESSAVYHDSTIMCFDKPNGKDKSKREESVIVSLCDQLKKATVTNSEKISTELEVLLKMEKQNILALRIIDEMKKSHLISLQYVRKLINDKKPCEAAGKTLTKETPEATKIDKFSPQREQVVSKPCAVIKSCPKSPSYEVPKKTLCWRKKVLCKSMPNVSNVVSTPVKADMNDKALSVYMRIKKDMDFLETPVAKRDFHVPDTPAVTSHNIQKQLGKLYDENEN